MAMFAPQQPLVMRDLPPDVGYRRFAEATTPSRVRAAVVALAGLNAACLLLMRSTLSVAVAGPEGLAAAYGWSNTERGVVLGAFFYGYVACQVPGGLVATKAGAKPVLLAGMALSVAASLLTPAAADAGLHTVVAARVALGLGQGCMYPAYAALFGAWLPHHEQGKGIALANLGDTLGSIAGMTLTPPLMASALGWRAAFLGPGLLGLLWLVTWWLFVTSSPEHHPTISADELAHIQAGRRFTTTGTTTATTSRIPWRQMLTSPAVVAQFVTMFCFDWSAWTFFTFLPQYLHQHLQLDMAATGLVAALPMVASGVGLVVAGAANDALLHRGWALRNVRRGFNTVRIRSLSVPVSPCVPRLTRLVRACVDNRRRGCCRRAASSR